MERTFIYHVRSILRVHDGDTCTLLIDLGFDLQRKVDVRISGIDTPEMRGASIAAAAIARDCASAWLAGALLKGLVLESLELDKYGRVLGALRCTANSSVSLANFLCEKGLAKLYDGGAKSPFTAAQCAAIVAKKQSLGV